MGTCTRNLLQYSPGRNTFPLDLYHRPAAQKLVPVSPKSLNRELESNSVPYMVRFGTMVSDGVDDGAPVAEPSDATLCVSPRPATAFRGRGLGKPNDRNTSVRSATCNVPVFEPPTGVGDVGGAGKGKGAMVNNGEHGVGGTGLKLKLKMFSGTLCELETALLGPASAEV